MYLKKGLKKNNEFGEFKVHLIHRKQVPLLHNTLFSGWIGGHVIYFKLFIIFQICSLLRGGIAERGGVRVGHRIIEINCQSVVAVPHEKIVALLANSVGEVTFSSFNSLPTG